MNCGDDQPYEGKEEAQHKVGDYPFWSGGDGGEVYGEYRQQHGRDEEGADDVPDADDGGKEYSNEDRENGGDDQPQPYGFHPAYGSFCPAQKVMADSDGGQKGQTVNGGHDGCK